jgi:hypothetical protein
MNGAESVWIQFGALGIVGFVVWRVVGWLTNSLNGKLDRLTDATHANTAAARETTGAIRQLTRAVERQNAQDHQRDIDEL